MNDSLMLNECHPERSRRIDSVMRFDSAQRDSGAGHFGIRMTILNMIEHISFLNKQRELKPCHAERSRSIKRRQMG
jgi:hypothetical protein